MTQMYVLEFLISKGPGRTVAELAKAIFGDRGEQLMVYQDCRLLEAKGLIERKGQGGVYEPYRLYAKQKPAWAGVFYAGRECGFPLSRP